MASKRRCTHPLRTERKVAAEVRNVTRTPMEQLARLDERLGVNIGAEKERLKLTRRLSKDEAVQRLSIVLRTA